MRCTRCTIDNPEGSRHCAGCGALLAAPPEAERRQITVLFCDLVDSTALAHRLDPEDLRELIRDYQQRTREVVARYEGFTARYIGDGILVYFGYPRAHEDDATRAIHTGLAIVEAVARSTALPQRLHIEAPQVRIGIATGMVVVGDLIGEDASEQAIAIGETPNLAARLQSLAIPDTVVIAQATRELAGGAFDYADLGAQSLKGFHEPVQAWQVVRASEAESRFEAARSRRLTPLVAREREIAHLRDAWRCASDGAGRVVLLTGEAGIGKSRLAETLVEYVAGERHAIVRYQCSPWHANSALHPFIQQLERLAGFRRGDSDAVKLDKLEAFLARTAPSMTDAAPLYAALLSLPSVGRHADLELTPQQQKDRTMAALIDELRARAVQAPLLVVVEDVHWIDPTSRELVARLVREVRDWKAMLVVTSRWRPDVDWLDRGHVSELALERLDREASATMARRVLEDPAVPRERIDVIAARADGVPLFIEELAKAVAAADHVPHEQPVRPSHRPAVPSTLQDSLMARLDRLGPAKEVAQAAAVIGREFSRDLIAAMCALGEGALDHALSTLIGAEIVFGRGAPPYRAFTFKHALVQDAAYASLLRTRRQQWHGRIAEILTRQFAEGVRAEHELVAHHLTEAGQALFAAKHWALAAQSALDRSANVEALGHAARGLEVLEGAAEGRARSTLELNLEILRGAASRAVSGFAASAAERSFARAKALCEELGDVPRLIDARRGLFSCYYARGALSLALEQGVDVAALGQRIDNPGSRMLGHWMVGCVMFWQGDFPAARRELEQAFSLYDPNAQRARTLALQIDPGVNALLHLSWLRWILGHPDQAIDTSERAIAAARELAQPFAVAMALFFACTTRACCGQHAALRPLLDELAALTAEHKLRYLESCAVVLEAQEAIVQGRHVDGLARIRQAFAEFEAQEAGVGFPWVMSIAATAHLGLGRIDEGLAALAQGFAAVARHGEHHWEAELWRLRGELLLRRGASDQAEAEEAFGRAIEVAAGQSARSLELRARTGLSRLHACQGRRELARRGMADALTWFREGFDTADLREAAAVVHGGH